MMKRKTTEELIAELAAAPAPDPFSPARAAIGMAVSVLIGLVIVWAAVGWRADLTASLLSPVVLAKLLLPLSLSIMSLYFALQFSRPDADRSLWPMAAPASIAFALVLAAAAATPRDMIVETMAGQTALSCVVSVLALSIAPMLVGVAFLRSGASIRPYLSGALVGLASGAGAAAGYALSCTEDSPLFFVTWYGAGIILSAVAGALAGGRLLRW